MEKRRCHGGSDGVAFRRQRILRYVAKLVDCIGVPAGDIDENCLGGMSSNSKLSKTSGIGGE
jgi:hypothetical protein